jgi:tetratricopeptide (TPR) repeat protein
MQTRNQPDRDAALRERLQLLVQEHPQAEIARKTGVGKHNVSRYLKGTKIPGEFLCALVEQMGVNPSWLLAGEGTPYLSDVTAGTAKMGGNLLELVQAMTEVAKMRLGALAGKTHLKVLRQLDDALRDYERLREELNSQSRPFFETLLSDYRDAIFRHNLERAAHLRRASHQIARLCDDERLKRELYARDAYHEFQLKHLDNALDLQRKVLMGVIGAEDQVSERMLVEAFNYCRALAETGRFREAYATCGAALELGRELSQLSRYRLLEGQRGQFELELGNLRQGLRLMSETIPRLKDREAGIVWGELLLAQLLAGILDWRGAMETGVNSVSRSASLVRWAFWSQDVEAIRAIVARFAGQEHWQVLDDSFLVNTMRDLVKIRQGDRKTYRRWRKEAFEPEYRRKPAGVQRIMILIENSTLAIAAADRDASRIVRKTEDEISALPGNRTSELLWNAMHHRNVLQCKAPANAEWKALRKKAAGWFTEMVENGYAAFAPLVEDAV